MVKLTDASADAPVPTVAAMMSFMSPLLEEDPNGDRAGRRGRGEGARASDSDDSHNSALSTTSPVKGEPSSLCRVTSSEVVSVTLEPLVLMT